MHIILKNVLIVLCVYILIFSHAESKSDSKSPTLEHVKRELRKFIPVLKVFRKNEADILVRFSKTVEDRDGNRQCDSFVLSSKLDNGNSTEDDSKLDEETLQIVFGIASYYNATAVVSTEKFARDGTLTSRQFHVEDVTIDFNNGSTKIVYKNIDEHVQHEDEIALDSYVSLMKGFELPIEVHRQIYNKEGEIEKEEFTKYEPKKVKIVDTNMPLDMQLLSAEVLKKSFLIKNETADRMNLLAKFLTLKYPLYIWKGEAGETNITIKNTTAVMKAILNDSLYSITGRHKFL